MPTPGEDLYNIYECPNCGHYNEYSREGKTMTTTVKEIVEAKRREGGDAFLWLRPSGECVLFDCKMASIVYKNAISRWDVDAIERDQLIETGLVDCQD